MTSLDQEKISSQFPRFTMGVIIGVYVAIACIDGLGLRGGTLVSAQERYQRCMGDFAPPQRCAEKYLIPKGSTP